MTPLETEADPNIRVGPLRWGRPHGSVITIVDCNGITVSQACSNNAYVWLANEKFCRAISRSIVKKHKMRDTQPPVVRKELREKIHLISDNTDQENIGYGIFKPVNNGQSVLIKHQTI